MKCRGAAHANSFDMGTEDWHLKDWCINCVGMVWISRKKQAEIFNQEYKADHRRKPLYNLIEKKGF